MNHPASRRTVISLGLAAVITGATATAAQAGAASLTLKPAAGPAGTRITVTGTGFPGKTAGTLTCAGAATQFTTAKNGSFTAAVTVPAGTPSSVAVTATVNRTTASRTFTVQAPATHLPPVSSSPLRFGIATAGGMGATAEIDAIAGTAGEQPSIILGYKDFRQPLPIAEMDSVTARGAVPMITWEPWTAGGAEQPAYTLAAIDGGSFDPYIRQWGAGLAAWGKPVMLRFAHEMNGDWYPWCETVNGNKAGDYIRAWRHVHDLITAAGAANVTWVWSPNGGGPGDMAAMYPGDDYVDILGIDAYNWGTTAPWGSWLSPEALYGPWLEQLRAIAPGLDIIVTETACAEPGGSKADWITALIPYLKSQPDVTGFVWFDLSKETDWRISSSATAANAFAAALAARR